MTDPGLDADRRAFVAGARTATLVTIGPDGTARPVPICFVLDPDASVLFTPIDEKPKRSHDPHDLARVRDIESRPEVAVLVDRWDEDWTRLAWVQVIGLTTVRDVAAHGDALAALAARYPQYREQPPRGPLLCLAPERVVHWRAADPA